MKPTRFRHWVLVALILSAGSTGPFAVGNSWRFEVTVTNLTPGQHFGPVLVASHAAGVSLFEVGKPARENLIILAEHSSPQPLAEELESDSRVLDVGVSGDWLAPGESVTVTVNGSNRADKISVVAMLAETNDGFMGLSGVLATSIPAKDLSRRIKKPKHGKHRYYRAVAYDAGSEPNDESCASIPGPACGGEGYSPDVDGEGRVRHHPGIEEVGELTANEHGWSGAVAEILIQATQR